MTGSRRSWGVLMVAVTIALACGFALGMKVADADPKVTPVAVERGASGALRTDGRATRLQLRSDIAALGDRRAPLRRQLAEARTVQGRTAIARDLAAVYRDAVREIEASALIRRRDLAQRLRGAATAYDTLAASFADRRRKVYKRAVARVDGGEGAVNRLLRSAFSS